MSALVRRRAPGCLERTRGSRTLWRGTGRPPATACCKASRINSFRLEPLSAAADFTRRNRGSGKSTVVLIKAYSHKSAVRSNQLGEQIIGNRLQGSREEVTGNRQ